METKNNSGAIFKNDKKTSEKAPDYKGKVNVNGKEMEISLWFKESQKGTKYFSASFQEPFIKNNVDATYTAKNNIKQSSSNFMPNDFRIDSKDDLPF
jgi:uncharacterized protein (DUF736 family)